jgi:hypothetical protein
MIRSVNSKTWDENMIDGHVIEMLNKNNEIGYYSAKVPLIYVVFLLFFSFLFLFFSFLNHLHFKFMISFNFNSLT